MGRSTLIVSNIHFDRLYKPLPQKLKNLYLDLLTHPNGNKAGYFQLDISVHQILRRDGDYIPTEEECRQELETETGLWMYDRKNDLVLIPTFLKYNKIGSPKTFQSMRYELEQLPASNLCIEFIYRVYEYTDGRGLDYIPPKMIHCAKGLLEMKRELSLHEGIIQTILLP